jgi:hypothetical protein
LYFKANNVDSQHDVFPPGWTIVLNSEHEDQDDAQETPATSSDKTTNAEAPAAKKSHTHRFKVPSLRHDHLFISSISNPASDNFRPANSPTRQIAMMLWATLWWYFHQAEPAPQLTTSASANTAEAGKPKGDWRVNINREGIFAGKHLLPKLERMGLIASEDSTVGLELEDGAASACEGWTKMFVSRRSFWQLDPRIYLYQLPSLSPMQFPIVSPTTSRPTSPNPSARDDGSQGPQSQLHRAGAPPGPYASSSHLPTFYPPAPTQYTFSNHIRHPIRPKPPRQGEVFYTRYIPSLEQTLSFRVASLSKRPQHPVQHESTPLTAHDGSPPARRDLLRVSGTPGAAPSTTPDVSTTATPSTTSSSGNNGAPSSTDTLSMTDVELLHKWMNDPRVAASWGEQGPVSHQEAFLKTGLTTRHSFPVIGSFDGKPFAYFEIYWVKEDRLGGYIGGDGVGEWDRGLHVLVGEQEFRGPHRIRVWLSALVHYCLLADARTSAVFMEPRVDNVK